MDPTAAKKEPMIKVTEMTLLILIPINWLVSKSLATARIAIPTLVWLISCTSRMTSMMVSTGVIRVTRLVVAPNRSTWSEIQGMVG